LRGKAKPFMMLSISRIQRKACLPRISSNSAIPLNRSVS